MNNKKPKAKIISLDKKRKEKEQKERARRIKRILEQADKLDW